MWGEVEQASTLFLGAQEVRGGFIEVYNNVMGKGKSNGDVVCCQMS